MIDESLRWLIANGRIKEAKVIIHKACKRNKKQYDDVVSVSGFRDFELRFEARVDVKNGKTNSINNINLLFARLLKSCLSYFS